MGALSWGSLWDTTLAHLEKSDWQAGQMELLAVESSQCKVYTQERIDNK
jgi:hypothetical protein